MRASDHKVEERENPGHVVEDVAIRMKKCSKPED